MEMRKKTLFALIFLSLLSFTYGHVPEFEDSDSLIDSVLVVEDPLKSRVVYGNLASFSRSNQYVFELRAGQRFLASVLSPDPDLFFDLSIREPSGVYINIAGSNGSEAAYEPFVPSHYYVVAVFDKIVNSSGRYVLTVSSKAEGGNFALSSGYLESFTLFEWLSVPIESLRIYRWTSQSWASIFAPIIVVFIGGLLFMYIRSLSQLPPLRLLVFFSSLFYLGGVAVMLFQMVRAILIAGFSSAIFITLLFILAGLAAGLFIARAGLREVVFSRGDRISLFALGIFGFAVWAGFIIGPVLSIISSLTPQEFKHKQSH